jgi:hypothetical protein
MAIYNGEKIYILSENGIVTAIKEGIDNWHSRPQQNTAADAKDNANDIDIEEIIADSQKKRLPPYPIFCDAYSDLAKIGVGSVYPLQKTVGMAKDFIDNLRNRTKLDIKAVVISKNKLIGPKITMHSTNNWKIYLNNQEDGTKQFYKLYLTLNNELKDENRQFQYIDLRFEDRVYIK